MVQTTERIKISSYSMKMRLYPNKEQAERIDLFLHALHVAYNMTFYEVFQKNPEVCTKPNADGTVWPDFKKIVGKEWKAKLIEMNPIVGEVPAAAITTKNGLFKDGQTAWNKGMKRRPVNEQARKEFHFYNSDKPRRSFAVQIPPKNISPSESNGKVAWITLPKIDGKIKARGFNEKLRFGKDGEYSMAEAVENKLLKNAITVRVSKDTCGDYYLSATYTSKSLKEEGLYIEKPASPEEREDVGIDVGIKSIATLSDGTTIDNKHFKKEKERALKKLGKQLSGRWGPSNEAFRLYNKQIRAENRTSGEEPIPLSKPSGRYLAAKDKRAHIERKIARRRETFYHQQTAFITKNYGRIAIEDLSVRNMFKNRHLSNALGDAAMSDFLSMLKYKADMRGSLLRKIGKFDASSQICSECGEQNEMVKNLSVREWTCPKCGAHHDRDVNAAKNILAFAHLDDHDFKPPDAVPDKNEPEKKAKRRQQCKVRLKKGEHIISDEYPDIIVKYSIELSKEAKPRYVIVNKTTGGIIDDANGAGFTTITRAKNCYKAKKKYAAKIAASVN